MNSRPPKFFLKHLAFLLLAYSAAAQPSASNVHYLFNTLTTRDGLPDDIVHATIMDRQGFLWFGTKSALARWDGSEFKVYRNTHLPGQAPDRNPSASEAFALAEDPDGNIWIATMGGGLNRFDPVAEKFTVFNYDQNDPSTLSYWDASALCFDAQGNFWVGTYSGGLNLFEPKTGKSRRFPLVTGALPREQAAKRNTIHHILPDIADPNRLWLATDNGLARFEKSTGKVTLFQSTAPKTQGMSIHCLDQNHPDTLWLATYGGGITRFDVRSAHWTYFPPMPGEWAKRSSSKNIFLSLLRKSEHEFWVASLDGGFGLFDCATGHYKFFPHVADDPLSPPADLATSLYLDPKGRIWIATKGKGVCSFEPEKPVFQFAPLPATDCRSIPATDILGFAFDRKRPLTYAVATGCAGFFILNEVGQVLKKVDAEGYPGQYQLFQTALTDRKNRVWVGGNHSFYENTTAFRRPILFQFDPETERLREFRHPSFDKISAPIKSILCALESRDGRLWFGADNGFLLEFDEANDQFRLHRPAENLPKTNPDNYREGAAQSDIHAPISQLVEDRAGNLWFSTHGEGVFRFDPRTGKATQFLCENVERKVTNLLAYGLALVGDTAIWAATSGAGIQIIRPQAPDNQAIEELSYPHGLPSDRVIRLAVEPSGRIWAATTHALSHWEPGQKLFVQHGTEEGLSNLTVEQHPLAISPQGRLLLGQTGGVFSKKIGGVDADGHGGQLQFTSLKIFDEEVFFGKNINFLSEIQLEHDQNNLSLRFANLEFFQPEQTHYQYRLVGLDEKWTTLADGSNTAVLNHLPPGAYTLRVRATLSGAERTLNIRIRYPWWRTWWFYLFCAAGFGAVVFGAFRYRELQRQKREKLRLSIARDLHDEVGSTLSSISILSESALRSLSGELEKSRIGAIGEQVRSAMTSISDIVWSVNPENDSMEKLVERMLLFASDTLENAGIELQLDLPDDFARVRLPMQKRKDFYLIFKEAVNNCARHSGANAAKISLSRADGLLVFELRDNGRGFAQTVDGAGKINGFGGNGLPNMTVRAASIGGKISVETAPGAGFSLKMEVPLGRDS